MATAIIHTAIMRDGKRLPVPGWLSRRLEKTQVGDLMERYGVI